MTPDQDYVSRSSVSGRLAHCRQWVNACCVSRQPEYKWPGTLPSVSAVRAKKKAWGLPCRQGGELSDMASLNHLGTLGSGWTLLGQGRGWLTEKQKSQLERDTCRFGNGWDQMAKQSSGSLGCGAEGVDEALSRKRHHILCALRPRELTSICLIATSHLPGSLLSLGAFTSSPFLTGPFINDHKQSLIWQ